MDKPYLYYGGTRGTGIRKLDKIIGGGLLEDSILLIIYNTYSLGWALGAEILKNRIKEGDFGVIINTVLPLSTLSMEISPMGIDIYKEGEEGNLAIIDIFASYNRLEYPYDYVYTLSSLDISTFVPKYTSAYRKILREHIKDRRPVGLVVTSDGFGFLMGEQTSIRINQKLLTLKETARMTEKRKRPINIWLLNKDRVSNRYISWLALYSQYIIEFCSSGDVKQETMIVRKSPLLDFEPGIYKFRVRRGKIEIT
ncbi:MAG TPA: hypothetical protein EYH24_07620 [Thermococcus paralvinellae]|uniref:KaiC-like domain-containing protein n=1 Tax=Thermococcus paralvinellae TaxID=582419 RepID=A0A832ZIV0_9EURY|nr:hypothetical protein [Thermococcus paralvinellae]